MPAKKTKSTTPFAYNQAKKSKSTRDKSKMPALNPEKDLSQQPVCLQIQQKSLSPHETSLKSL